MAFADISLEEALVLEAYEGDILDEEETNIAQKLRHIWFKPIWRNWVQRNV